MPPIYRKSALIDEKCVFSSINAFKKVLEKKQVDSLISHYFNNNNALINTLEKLELKPYEKTN